ncbi:thiamine phosphate synthase [Cytophagaceae bacterium YF14B1]|uniref:Thiamine-phosphate synthase n=1 Tax=Xanthocytophaga flava TaxID=3048013 RepID=A0AAE3QV47_9BACT|nr:thiamine phosphate synthase [Xanthocytophaga flavus]MDJ1483958.1 thiamine phosphate synthase [Xanthocytophaga flavus]
MSKLYLVTDSLICQQAGYNVEYVVEQACKAGVNWVQLREKDLSTEDFIALAHKVLAITRMYNAKLIINDRVEVAVAVDADGVHIGQDDMSYTQARELMGYTKIIGLSVNNLPELTAANALDVDYVGIASIFSTTTKLDTTSELGIEGLRSLCTQTKHSTYAIGGINQTNIQQVIQTGVTGVAVVSAICGTASPYDATRTLIQLIENA